MQNSRGLEAAEMWVPWCPWSWDRAARVQLQGRGSGMAGRGCLEPVMAMPVSGQTDKSHHGPRALDST